ncbi:MAG: 5'/3'-nucleotidase SurE [Spartobacteria bacterium]|nr:5'/3'-nucleotidase SurE [Spartobacteria bacterium]
MKILISNDDGIYADGIMALYQAVKDLGDVTIVAPDTQRSAVGHAITLSDPIKSREIHREDGFKGYAVSGTPADCVKLAVCGLMDAPPDLVISGINLGPNAGISIIYSGTVSAATEGNILGIPSIAVSLGTFSDPIWETGIHYARESVLLAQKNGIPAGCLVNVNVPNIPRELIKGIKLTRMGSSRFVETFDRRTDPAGNVYFWMDGDLEPMGDTEGSDLIALEQGYVSITPIGLDLTHHEALQQMQGHWDTSGT